jgi:hypothetical protein
MTSYELTNDQRKYFGLTTVDDNWDKQSLSETVTVYFDKNKLIKILNYCWGYLEYDTEIDTRDRKILLPKTPRGKEQKLTVPRILKIKGCGVQFSGSFQGGGIHVYDNRRNLFFIKSFSEEGEIKSYGDIDKWVSNYITKLPTTHFNWLDEQLSQKRLKVNVKEGDIIAFRIAHGEYGFARVLLDVFTERKKGDIIRPEIYWVHPRSLIVAPYAFYADTLEINIDALIEKKTLPTLCIFDLDVYRGEMPIIGHRPLKYCDRQIPFPNNKATSITIPYTKSDIENFIATNGMVNT